MKTVAEKTGSNFATLNGLLAEMTESCTTSKGQASSSQAQASGKERVNVTERMKTETEIRKMAAERIRLVNDIINAQEDGPGVAWSPQRSNVDCNRKSNVCREGRCGIHQNGHRQGKRI